LQKFNFSKLKKKKEIKEEAETAKKKSCATLSTWNSIENI
jgi:hypothetical protein